MGEPVNHRLKTVLCASVAIVMVLTILPSMQSSFSDNERRSAGILANGSRTFNVGVVDYTGTVGTLNPFMYTTSAEYETIWPCYSMLLTYDINANRIGDLATSWSLAPDQITWNFKLARNAYFIDPAAPTSTAHPVTAADVMWTYWEINNNSANHLSSYFNTGGVGILSRMWTGVDQFDLYVQTKTPYAPFLGALSGIPIVPKYIWSNLPNGKTTITYSGVPVIGSGAFYTATTLPIPNVAILKRNTLWFQEVNRGWQLHVDTLQYKSEMSQATAWADLKTSPPLIDTYLNVDPGTYLSNVVNGQTPGILGWAQSTGFVYEYQLNQLSLAQRAALGMTSGSNNQLLLNPTVKLAMAMCVDKQSFINQVILGLGTVADSLVPDVNPWHYTYPSPIQYDPSAARALLMAAGWAYDSLGNPATSTTVPLYRYGVLNHTVYQPLSFRLVTLSTSADWVLGSNLLKQWAALGGVQLNIYVVSTSQMNSMWYSGNYDAWLWDWVFSPTSDPSTDILSIDTSMAIGTWSGSYWHNASYDSLYNRSLTVMDPVARRQLTDAMQASVYEDHNDQLIAYAKCLYAVNTDKWYGPSYGDWAAHWTLIPDQGLPWLYMQLSPVDNHAPTVTVGSQIFSGYIDSPISFFGSAVDASTLKYQWYWGDGTTSGWQTSATQSHTYATDGIYTAYLAAQEQGTADGFISYSQTSVIIIDPFPPTITSIVVTPSSGIDTGTNVQFTAYASDLEGDPLYYNWNFGDTFTGVGQTVTHQFMTAGSYTVVLSVDDGHTGPGRPATMTKLVSVAINHPPIISIIGSQVVPWKGTAFFTATASDPDLDPLRFTWVWGDGSTLVTTTPANVTHVYIQKGTFSLYVYADDLTGLPGHNVSALDIVKTGGTTPPYGLTLSVNKSAIWVTQSVTFTATAQDPAGDGMRFTISCGDGSYIIVDKPGTANNAVVTVTASHTYLSAGSMTARLYVTDGLDNVSASTSVTVTVTLNSPPLITPLTNKYNWAGALTAFTATAVDSDGDTLRYTWNFGDGTPLQVGQTTTHTYVKAGMYTFTVNVNDLTGLVGHNVSSSATASIAFNLNLVAGWNFISLPLSGFGYKASTLGLATGDVIVSRNWTPPFDPLDHVYIKGISPPSADFVINPSTGYWVWVAASKTLHIYGSVPTTMQVRAYTVPVTGGWVDVGFLGFTTRHASDIPKMWNGTGKIIVITKYDPWLGGYVTYIPGTPLNDFLLVPGQAYWCWATSSGTLSYMP